VERLGSASQTLVTRRRPRLHWPTSRKWRLLAYPVVLLWTMPIVWARSLWASRVLLEGRWERYMGFDPVNAINSFFYRNQWLNINRYGRQGRSSVVGLGDHPLSRWFHLSLPASYIYGRAGAVCTLVGTLLWVVSHFLWLQESEAWWVIVLVLTLFLSTTAYAMAFGRQNYQILGWMWLPTALFGSLNQQWVTAGLAWFAASLAGITPLFFALPISLVISYEQGSLWPVVVLLPASVGPARRALELLRSSDWRESVGDVAKLIGLTSKGVRYRRTSMKLGSFNRYCLFVYGLSIPAAWFLQGAPPMLLFLGWTFFLVNQLFVRVADEQSAVLVFVSLMVAVLALGRPSPIALAILWMTAALPPYLLLLRGRGMRIDALVPFDHIQMQDSIRGFFSSVSPGERVLFSFSDPAGEYEKIFDGYRSMLELPFYVAAEKGVHLMPDWYAIAETNEEGAPSFWGRSPLEVKNNLERWGAKYAVVYQCDSEFLDATWSEGFALRDVLNWSRFESSFQASAPWPADRGPPKWFLLEYTDSEFNPNPEGL
jgi:hypothetical protein